VTVEALTLRDFRSYERAEVVLGSGLTVVSGRNGAGKTNLLEGLYFGCVGRSCRTSNEREVVRFDAGPHAAVRVVVEGRDADGDHELSVGVWERGAGETLSSGTSAVAASAAAVANGWCESPVTVHLAGGDLHVELAEGRARLTGPAEEICTVELAEEFEL